MLDLSKPLLEVQKTMKKIIKTEHDLLNEMVTYVVDTHGKMLRPRLLLLTFKLLKGRDIKKAIELAAIFEIIHNATLVHDDINDEASMRRGKPALHVKYNVGKAVVCGDYLYVRAVQKIINYSREVLKIIADTCVEIAEGEIMQSIYRQNPIINEHLYFDIIRKKTASTFGACAQLGARLITNNEKTLRKLYLFGVNLGLAFQLIDDILDITGDPDKLGKPIMVDFKEGHYNSVILHTYRNATDKEQKLIESLFDKTDKTDMDIDMLKKLILYYGSVEYVKKLAKRKSELAKKQLSGFKENEYKRALLNLADEVVSRES